MEKKLAELLKRESGKEDISPATRFDDLVDDSLEFLQLMLTVQQHLGIEVPDEAISRINTVADLLVELNAQLPN